MVITLETKVKSTQDVRYAQQHHQRQRQPRHVKHCRRAGKVNRPMTVTQIVEEKKRIKSTCHIPNFEQLNISWPEEYAESAGLEYEAGPIGELCMIVKQSATLFLKHLNRILPSLIWKYRAEFIKGDCKVVDLDKFIRKHKFANGYPLQMGLFCDLVAGIFNESSVKYPTGFKLVQHELRKLGWSIELMPMSPSINMRYKFIIRAVTIVEIPKLHQNVAKELTKEELHKLEDEYYEEEFKLDAANGEHIPFIVQDKTGTQVITHSKLDVNQPVTQHVAHKIILTEEELGKLEQEYYNKLHSSVIKGIILTNEELNKIDEQFRLDLTNGKMFSYIVEKIGLRGNHSDFKVKHDAKVEAAQPAVRQTESVADALVRIEEEINKIKSQYYYGTLPRFLSDQVELKEEKKSRVEVQAAIPIITQPVAQCMVGNLTQEEINRLVNEYWDERLRLVESQQEEEEKKRVSTQAGAQPNLEVEAIVKPDVEVKPSKVKIATQAQDDEDEKEYSIIHDRVGECLNESLSQFGAHDSTAQRV